MAISVSVGVYTGPETFPSTRKQAIASAKEHIENIHIVELSAQDIINDNIKQLNIDILIMPGGKSVGMEKALGNIGCYNIHQFVLNGGVYLGWCGGAYLASNKISFAPQNHHLHITHTHILNLFKGCSNGPMDKSFTYTEKSDSIIDIKWMNNKIYKTHIHGGGYFDLSGLSDYNRDNITILANYTIPDFQLPCIIECAIGYGGAILSHPHPEYCLKSFSSNKNDIALQKELICSIYARAVDIVQKNKVSTATINF